MILYIIFTSTFVIATNGVVWAAFILLQILAYVLLSSPMTSNPDLLSSYAFLMTSAGIFNANRLSMVHKNAKDM